MSRFWILAADHSGARVFATDKRAGPIEEVDSLDHPEGRLREQDFDTKEPGTGFPRAGAGRDSVADENHNKRVEEDRFAREVAEYLERGLQQKRYKELYVLSEPRFLGALRPHLSEKVRKALKEEIDKDVARQPPEKVRKQLPEWL